MFPAEFVGRGDMSRGGLLLRSVSERRELEYIPVAGAVRHGQRPAKLDPATRPRRQSRTDCTAGVGLLQVASSQFPDSRSPDPQSPIPRSPSPRSRPSPRAPEPRPLRYTSAHAQTRDCGSCHCHRRAGRRGCGGSRQDGEWHGRGSGGGQRSPRVSRDPVRRAADGDLRWKPPQPVKNWEGVRSARPTQFGAALHAARRSSAT